MNQEASGNESKGSVESWGMKGILLAAGFGTRLKPITEIINKIALPIYNQPVFFYGLKTLIDSDIKEVIIVSNPATKEQLQTLLKLFPLKDKINIKFAVQKKPLGMVDAIISAKEMIGKSKIIVYPADNVVTSNYKKAVEKFKSGAFGFLTKVADPSRFGCPVYSKDGNLIRIVEKPARPQTNWVVTAPYLFDNQIFNLVKSIKLSKRGELEITSLLNLYLSANQLKLHKNKGRWFDIGTFDSLLLANNYISKHKEKFFP